MKTNLFNFKKLKKDNITLEEESYSPFLNFFIKYRLYLLLFLFLLAIIMLIIGIYYSVIHLQDSTKVVTNISTVVVEFEDTSKFNSVNLKPITGGLAEKLFYKRYGNVGLLEGIIFEVKEVNSRNGVVTFYSDGSALIHRNTNTYARISALENGEYGINENGEVVLGAIIKEIAISTTKTLADGTELIYFSDSSCRIIIPSKKLNMMVRNSSRITIENNRLNEIEPSGVTKVEELDNSLKVTYYENGTIKVEKKNERFIVRNEEDIKIDKKDISFPNNNEATILNEVSLQDGSKIIYYTDGSAEILKANESIMVRKSKDIVYDNDGVIEIIDTKYASVSLNKVTPNNEEVTYLNNGGGLIKNPNGTYEYVHENSNIKYDEDGNIKDKVNSTKGKSYKTTPKGAVVVDFDDDNSIIIVEEGYRVVKTQNIVYDGDGNIVRIIGDEDDIPNEDSISDNRFVITNSSGNKIKYVIALEVTDDYKQYAPKWLDPRFLKFNLVENNKYFENQTFGDKKLEIGTVLEGGTKIKNETFILYESVIENGEKAEIILGLWLDYTDITNDYQDSVFAGTIKVYSETIN